MPPMRYNIRSLVKQTKIEPKFESLNYQRSLSDSQTMSFENAIKFPIYLSQISCMIPLLHGPFKWNSLKVFFPSIIICCQALMVIFTVLWVKREGLSLHRVGSVLFFFGTAVMMILMIRLAYMWPKLMKKWNEIESHFGYQRRLKIIFILSSTILTIFSTDLILVGIFKSSSLPRARVLKMYANRTFPQIFGIMEYKMWRALPVIYVNVVSVLLYCFGDQLIMMITWTLGNYFSIYNRDALALRRKSLSEDCWKILRVQYIRLSELCSAVDDCFCHLLSLTFIMHLYILCVTIQEGFLMKTSYETDGWEKIHAVLTFTTSMFRAFGICYTTVRVNEESKRILNVLYAVPSVSYCSEVELFIQQVLRNEVVLTGSHVFAMKRKFLLTIAGVIVSSQILLIQMRDFKLSRL